VSGIELVFVGDAAGAGPPDPARRVVVTDETWTAPSGVGDGPIAIRPLILEALAGRDLMDESLTLLDIWAERSGAIGASTVAGLSAWYHRRLHLWRWLHERLAWLAILDLLLADGDVSGLCLPVDEPALIEVGRLVAARRGLALRVAADGAEARRGDETAARPAPAGGGDAMLARLRRLPARTRLAVRRRRIDRRLARLAAEPSRLLVLRSPTDRQVVTTATGPRLRNPFLDPVIDALAASGHAPVVLELGLTLDDDAGWARLSDPAEARTLPGELLATRFSRPEDRASASAVEAAAERVGALATPLLVGDVDLGPAVAAELAAGIRGALAGRLRELPRMRRLLRRLRPTAIVLVNEYGRPEWLLAARAEGVGSAAVQHGIIHRLHVGYRYPARPPELLLPDRTYVFGEYEGRLLTDDSVYRPDEVVVSGSPRRDLAPGIEPDAGGSADATERDRVRAAVRTELGVPTGDRLVVVSTTAAAVLTRFGVVPGLGSLLDRPLPGIRFVVKLHPAEADGDRYERLVAGIGRAGGFEPARLSVVKAIDLYRLLGAADAHLGSYSTVLTEAVLVGTPNLLAATDASADLLGYVAAGVAEPVRDGADLARAVEGMNDTEGRSVADERARAAFVADHFRSGPAADRIARDLLARFPPA
jgi:hypothetical protein